MDPARAAARRSLGLALIFATAAIWIVSSFLSSSLVSSSDVKAAAVHPFLLTYLATSLFTLYLPLIHLKAWVTDALQNQNKHRTVDRTAYSALRDPHGQPPRDGTHGLEATKRAVRKDATNTPMYAALWAMPLWFSAQLTFNMSLAWTSVTSNTILSSTSSLFTFFLSMLLLGEQFSSKKLVAIIACIAGTALVTLSDNESSSGGSASLFGDALVVVSAGLYACYTVVMRKKMPGEEAEAHVGTFFGYLGLFSTVLLAPLVVVFLSLGVFSLSTIPTEAYLIILLEGLLDYVLSDYLWARAVMLLGPTIATLGLSVQIPMAAGAEFAMGGAKWTKTSQTRLMTISGTALILSGFFGINLSAPQSEQQQQQPAQSTPAKAELAKGHGGGDEALSKSEQQQQQQQRLRRPNGVDRADVEEQQGLLTGAHHQQV